MPKMIQIRDVPDQLHSVLKDRAAKEKMSLSDYLKTELKKMAAQPTMKEWLELTSRNRPISGKFDAAKLIRELRDNR